MSKLLILQENLSLYNVPLYKLLNEKYDLTVAYTKKNEFHKNDSFKCIKLEFYKLKGFYFIKNNFRKFCSGYDVVIFLADLHYFSFVTIPFFPRNFKVIPWTIGIRASYKRSYDLERKKSLVDYFYGIILRKSDAIIFYMKNPINYWKGFINEKKIFVALNTVDVSNFEINYNLKKDILFIGTLYKEKGIYELLDAYIEAKKRAPSTVTFPKLLIIGEGDEFNKIKITIKEKELENYIKLLGPIYDEEKLAEYFSKSLISISPNQAGLSVLKCFAYGIPFITRWNSITGGERLNIITNQNGILYKEFDELVNIIILTATDKNRYIQMGVEAKRYYDTNATTKIMAQGFINAIEYVLN